MSATEILANGAEVLLRFENGNDGVVLAKTEGAMPFVTWRYPVTNRDDTQSGDYCLTYEDGLRSFYERAGIQSLYKRFGG